jgi:hypothetical protein
VRGKFKMEMNDMKLTTQTKNFSFI